MRGTLTIAVTGLALLMLLPTAAATPADAYNAPLPASPAPDFGIAGEPDAVQLNPGTISAVTSQTLPGVHLTGAGNCGTNTGHACTTPLPGWNPNTGPTSAFECEIVSATGPWPTPPQAYLVQDLNSNDVLGDAGDNLAGPITLGNPGGGLLTTQGGSWVSGESVHIISAHQFAAGPWNAMLSLTPICYVV